MSRNTTPERLVIVNGAVIPQIRERGNARVNVEVHGYWSDDPITVYVDFDHFSCLKRNPDGSYDRGTPPLTFKVSHSSGGRDTKQVEDDAEAAEYFARALTDAALVVRDCRASEPALRAAYNEWRAGLERRAAEEKAARLAAIEADPELGTEGAKALCAELEANARQYNWAGVKLFHRGSESTTSSFTVELARDGKLIRSVDGLRVHRDLFPMRMAEKSARRFELKEAA